MAQRPKIVIANVEFLAQKEVGQARLWKCHMGLVVCSNRRQVA